MSLAVKDFPDHHDAEIVLKLYDLRREPVMRESRLALIRQFQPRTAEEMLAVTKPEHPLSTAFRQVTTYWEMAYGMIKHGVLHADFMIECNGAEGLLLFARVAPFLDTYRKQLGAHRLVNTEWVARNTDAGRRFFGIYEEAAKKAIAGK